MHKYLCAFVAVAVAGTAATTTAHGAIILKQYYASVYSFGTPDPDGAFHPVGTTAFIDLRYDDSLTYIGAPDSVTDNIVTIPGGITVTVGGDVFVANTYNIRFYNAGPSRSSADFVFQTTNFVSLYPVLHNGNPFAGGQPGYFQFGFNRPVGFVPEPIAPGLPFDPAIAFTEGLLRNNFVDSSHEYYFGGLTPLPTPAAAVVLAGGAIVGAKRRRRI